MPVSAYQRSILSARRVPLDQINRVSPKLAEAYEQAWRDIDRQLRESRTRQGFSRALWRAKQAELERIMIELGIELKADINESVREAASAVSLLRQTETNKLLVENDASGLLVDFTGIPQQVVERLALVQDVEGLKFSANIWGRNQTQLINRVVLANAAKTTSVADIAKQLQPFVIGFDHLSDDEKKLLKRGQPQTKAGMAIKHKTERLARTEIANAAWEAGRLSAEQSPVVAGVKWNLSNAHPKWDVCDILANQDLYGLGPGVYPPDKIPPRPHPNDLCYQTDAIRPTEEWGAPKPGVPLKARPDNIKPIRPRGVTDHYFNKQKDLAANLSQAAFDSVPASVQAAPQTWQSQVRALSATGVDSEVKARQIGAIIRTEFNKRLDIMRDRAKTELSFLNPEAVEDQQAELLKFASKLEQMTLKGTPEERAQEYTRLMLQTVSKLDPKLSSQLRVGFYEQNKTLTAIEVDEMFNLLGDLMRHHETTALKLAEDKKVGLVPQADTLKVLLSEVRDVGAKGRTHTWGGKSPVTGKRIGPGSKAIRDTVADASELFPTRWVDQSIDGTSMRAIKSKRGSYGHRPGGVSEFTVSGEGRSMFETTVHELGHRFESVNPEILKLEKEFYDRRTKGDRLELLGAGFRRDEETRRDDFTDPYIGKDYRGRYYEVLSMGLEGVYFGKYDIMDKDEDMADFILGLLGGL